MVVPVLLDKIILFADTRRSNSAPDLNDEEDDTLMVSQDYNVAMEEIKRQKRNIREWKHQQKLEQMQQQAAMEQAELHVDEEETIEQLQVCTEIYTVKTWLYSHLI